MDNKYIKTLLNSNKILSENSKPISGIKTGDYRLVTNIYIFIYIDIYTPDYLYRYIYASSIGRQSSFLVCSLWYFGSTLENTFLLVLPSPTRSVWVTLLMSLIRWLHSASWAALPANHFIPDFISGYAFRMISSAESFIIMWRHTFPILNSSTSKDFGSCRFPELVYKPTFEKNE